MQGKVYQGKERKRYVAGKWKSLAQTAIVCLVKPEGEDLDVAKELEVVEEAIEDEIEEEGEDLEVAREPEEAIEEEIEEEIEEWEAPPDDMPDLVIDAWSTAVEEEVPPKRRRCK